MRCTILLTFFAFSLAVDTKPEVKIMKKVSKLVSKCKNIKCPPVEEPVCVKMKHRRAELANRTAFILMTNPCELEMMKCHKADVDGITVPMKHCEHKDFRKWDRLNASHSRRKRSARHFPSEERVESVENDLQKSRYFRKTKQLNEKLLRAVEKIKKVHQPPPKNSTEEIKKLGKEELVTNATDTGKVTLDDVKSRNVKPADATISKKGNHTKPKKGKLLNVKANNTTDGKIGNLAESGKQVKGKFVPVKGKIGNLAKQDKQAKGKLEQMKLTNTSKGKIVRTNKPVKVKLLNTKSTKGNDKIVELAKPVKSNSLNVKASKSKGKLGNLFLPPKLAEGNVTKQKKKARRQDAQNDDTRMLGKPMFASQEEIVPLGSGKRGAPGMPGGGGMPGAPGMPGGSGYSGEDGMPGANGMPGGSGYSGEDGMPGANGMPGGSGYSGEDGMPGANGMPGGSGNSVEDGMPIINGRPGGSGYSGEDGMPGANGMPGESGNSGEDGMPGANGMPGGSGNSGEDGMPGAPGIPGGSSYSGEDGMPGASGVPGGSGNSGEDGMPGANGMPGRNVIPGDNGDSGYDVGSAQYIGPDDDDGEILGDAGGGNVGENGGNLGDAGEALGDTGGNGGGDESHSGISLEHSEELAANNQEYDAECPSVCPTRLHMVCGRCQHGIYRTFLSVCHLRMFACNHNDEELELVARLPCALSAPYIDRELNMVPLGFAKDPQDDDVVLRYIQCRERENEATLLHHDGDKPKPFVKLKKDQKCKIFRANADKKKKLYSYIISSSDYSSSSSDY